MVSVDQAKALFDKGTLFVDARVAAEYADKHIKGAINVPFKEEFPKVSRSGPETSSICPKCRRQEQGDGFLLQRIALLEGIQGGRACDQGRLQEGELAPRRHAGVGGQGFPTE